MSKAIIDLGYIDKKNPPEKYLKHFREKMSHPNTHGFLERKQVGSHHYKYICRQCGISWSVDEGKI